MPWRPRRVPLRESFFSDHYIDAPPVAFIVQVGSPTPIQLKLKHNPNSNATRLYYFFLYSETNSIFLSRLSLLYFFLLWYVLPTNASITLNVVQSSLVSRCDSELCSLYGAVCRKCIYQKLNDDELNHCPLCKIDLGCTPAEKLRYFSCDHSFKEIISPVIFFLSHNNDLPCISIW
jgi:hypothetical protein